MKNKRNWNLPDIQDIEDALSPGEEECRDYPPAKGLFARIMKKIFTILLTLIIVSSLLFGVFYKIRYEEACRLIEDLTDKLINKDDVTIVIIEEKLEEISELATASFSYSGLVSKENYRELFKTGVSIPFTKNSIEVSYSGIIKVGYDVEKITSKIDNKEKIVYMTLPEPSVLDNYIILDDMEFRTANNLLNPISLDQVQEYLLEIEKAELERALDQGIYDSAEDRLQKIILSFFAEFDEYTVEFL